MKRTRIIILFVSLALLLFSITKVNACAPSYDFIFSDELNPGVQFEWIVETLEATGDLQHYIDQFKVGQESLEQSDIITRNLTVKPNEIYR